MKALKKGGFRIFFLSIILFIIILPFTFAQQEDLKPWSDKKDERIIWDDFKGSVPDSTPNDAETWAGHNPEYHWKPIKASKKPDGTWECTVQIDSASSNTVIDRSKSWVKNDAKNNEVLNHERGHLDLAEKFRREKLQPQLDALVNTEYTGTGATLDDACKDASTKADAAYNKIRNEKSKQHLQAQADYDKETDHGRDKDKQKKWKEKFNENLKLEDTDKDTIPDIDDNCPKDPSSAQIDDNNDGIGDLCQLDSDEDFVTDVIEIRFGSDHLDPISIPEDLGYMESCFDGEDNDGDRFVDEEEIGCQDHDIDLVSDAIDNCFEIANSKQENSDDDEFGDICDSDDDNDAILDELDNCHQDSNLDQADQDKDGVGNACDWDLDGDSWTQLCVEDFCVLSFDNCPFNSNPIQEDRDGDRKGDACDIFPDAREIESCEDDPDTEGKWVILNDLSASGNCLEITSSEVILDCQDHSIIGNGEGIGIHVNGANSSIIKNCNVSKFGYGIVLFHAENNSIFGIKSANNLVSGFIIKDSHNNTIRNNNLSRNFNGIMLLRAENNTIFGNYITDSENYGLLLEDTNNNLIYNNNIKNNNKQAFDNRENKWFDPILGGNYWSDYQGVDINGDGIGDTNLPYNIPGGTNKDEKPFVKESGWLTRIIDSDGDGILDNLDNCPTISNLDQLDSETSELFFLDSDGSPSYQLFIGAWPSLGCGDVTSHQEGIEELLPSENDVLNGKTWQKGSTINWLDIYPGANNIYAYSHIYLFSPETKTVKIKFGSDDSARLWINGILKYSTPTCRQFVPDQSEVIVELKKGWNRILWALSQGSGGYMLSYRFTDLNNNPLRLKYTLNKPIGDGVGDVCDNCWLDSNKLQEDSNNNCPIKPYLSNPICGDICESKDTDRDDYLNDKDNCPLVQNPNQEDSDQLEIKIEAENYDSCSDSDLSNRGGSFRNDLCANGNRVDIQPTTDTGGGFNIGWIVRGEWLQYDVTLDVAGTYEIFLRTAARYHNGLVRIEIDGVTVAENAIIPLTGDWQTWRTVSAGFVALTKGTHTLTIYMTDPGQDNMNFNYFVLRISDNFGDACDSCERDIQNDVDSDSICGNIDNCPLINNPNQEDKDNDKIGDACDAQTCGNDKKEGTEVCDGTDLAGQTCQTQGFKYGTLLCKQDCTDYNKAQCTNAICGNKIIDINEECDDGNLVNGDGCSSLCKIEQIQITFIRGDSNGDGAVDVSDAVNTLNWLFLGTGSNICQDASDSNDDGSVDISDASNTLNFLFLGIGKIPQPYPSKGTDPTLDNLDCSQYPTPQAGGGGGGSVKETIEAIDKSTQDQQTKDSIKNALNIVPKGTLSVSSFPTGAYFYLDGKYKGYTSSTPFIIKDLYEGPYTIKFTKYNYETYQTTAKILPGQTTTIKPSLKSVASPTTSPTPYPSPSQSPSPSPSSSPYY